MSRTKRPPGQNKRARTDRRGSVAVNAPPVFGPAFGQWMMANVRAEVRAGRLRVTLDERGDPVTIH